MITKEELRKRLKNSLKTVKPGDLQAINQKMVDLLKFMTENYDDLVPDAKKL